MIAWTYATNLYCDDCAGAVIVKKEEDEIEDTGDSATYPQGPTNEGGGEADCPQNCSACGEFLENPLTPAGREYVREQLRENPNSESVQHWGEYYAVMAFDQPAQLRALTDIVYRALNGWRRFLPDLVPLHLEQRDTWVLSGWVVSNTVDMASDMASVPMTAHQSVTRGNRIGCWNFLSDADLTVEPVSIKVTARPMPGLQEIVSDDDIDGASAEGEYECGSCGGRFEDEDEAWDCCD